MTKFQLAKVSGIHLEIIKRAIVAAREKCPSLISKKGVSTKTMEIDYTLEECLYIMSCLPYFNPMINRWMKEAYITNKKGYVTKNKKEVSLLERDAKNFLWMYKHATGKPKACCTCMFLISRAINRSGVGLKPYCTFYERFLNRTDQKINIYHDRCPTYRMSQNEALIFTAVGPVFADKVGQFQDKILGYDKSDFTSKRKKGEPIVLLNEF